jgi:hypothetical protein
MANLGPSTTVTSNAVAVLTPVSTVTNPGPQGAQALRLLGVAKGVSGNATGDAAVMQIINASTWLPVSMITANSQLAGVSGSVATLAIGLFTAAAAGGTAIKSNAALAGNTGATAGVLVATTVTAVTQTSQQIFVNVGTALATSTVDVYLFGYDLSA